MNQLRTTVCGKTVPAEVFYHEHELRCTGCLRIERDRYKNALVDLRESPTTEPALKLWAANILRDTNGLDLCITGGTVIGLSWCADPVGES